MHYDPIKDTLFGFFSRWPSLQRLFYMLLNAVFLRTWYVKRETKKILGEMSGKSVLHVLDAGTGVGQYAYWMARTFPRVHVHAVDVKQDYLENAKRFFDATDVRNRISVAEDDLTRLESSGPFDFILSVDVMEHIEDDRSVFGNFRRVLAPGGCVLVITPSDLGGSDVSSEHDESFIGEHVRDGYSREELLDKLRKAGLEPTSACYTYGRYGSLAWRWLIKYPMKMLSVSWLFVLLLPFYYIPVFPIGMLFNFLDVRTANEVGTGLIVVAQKRRHQPTS